MNPRRLRHLPDPRLFLRRRSMESYLPTPCLLRHKKRSLPLPPLLCRHCLQIVHSRHSFQASICPWYLLWVTKVPWHREPYPLSQTPTYSTYLHENVWQGKSRPVLQQFRNRRLFLWLASGPNIEPESNRNKNLPWRCSHQRTSGDRTGMSSYTYSLSCIPFQILNSCLKHLGLI